MDQWLRVGVGNGTAPATPSCRELCVPTRCLKPSAFNSEITNSNPCNFSLASRCEGRHLPGTLLISSVQFSYPIVSDSFRPHGLQHARPPCPSPSPGTYSDSCPSGWWCHPTISSSVVPFSHPQSFPASRSFPMSQLFISRDQSIGVSASASVLPMNTQDWSPLGWGEWISLQSKGLSRVFSNTTAQNHQFFSAQLSLWSNSHIHTWLLAKP